MNYSIIIPSSERERVLRLEKEGIRRELEGFWIKSERKRLEEYYGITSEHSVTPSGGVTLPSPENNTGQTELVHRTPAGNDAENPSLGYPPPCGTTDQGRKGTGLAAGLGFDLYDGGSGGNANCLAIAILVGAHFANEEIEARAAALRVRAYVIMQKDLIAIRNRFKEQLQSRGLRPVDIERIVNLEVGRDGMRNVLNDPTYASMDESAKIQCVEIVEGFQLAIARVQGLLNDESNRPEGGAMMDTEFGGCMARDLGVDVLAIDCATYIGEHEGRKHPCHYFRSDIGERVEDLYNHNHEYEWIHEDRPEGVRRCMNRKGQPPVVIFRAPGHFVTGDYVGPRPFSGSQRSDLGSGGNDGDSNNPSSPPSDEGDVGGQSGFRQHPETPGEPGSLGDAAIDPGESSNLGSGGDDGDPNNPPSNEGDAGDQSGSRQPPETPSKSLERAAREKLMKRKEKDRVIGEDKGRMEDAVRLVTNDAMKLIREDDGMELIRNETFEEMKPYFPESHGKPRVDDRKVISGIVYVLRNDLKWRDVPEGYGISKTLRNRFVRWSNMGVFGKILQKLSNVQDENLDDGRDPFEGS
jgi:hypothetical protein